MTEHTLVWTYDKSEDSPKYYVCKNHKRVHGIELDTADIAQELARLLNQGEAAPDLLEACKEAVLWLSNEYPSALPVKMLDAAIAKATS